MSGLLRARRRLEFKRLYVGEDAHLGGEFERRGGAVFVSQFGEESRPAFLGFVDFGDVNAALLFEVTAFPGGTDRFKAEVPRIRVGALPEFDRAWFVLRVHSNRPIVLQTPGELREL